jgi:hypothetical protein
MRYAITLGVLALTMVLGSTGTASAAAMDDAPGTFRQTCKNIRMRGDRLFARCKNTYNQWQDTSLDDAYRCAGDITNVDGRLVCGQVGVMPRGDYDRTCRDIRMRFGMLYARCETRDGQWVDTSLDGFMLCTSPVYNDNGQLRCSQEGNREGYNRDRDRDRDHDRDRDRDRDRENGPRGSYRESCRNITLRGDTLYAQCETSEGRWLDTSIHDVDRCVGGIVNDEGRLVCTREGGRRVPQGSYAQTCPRVYVNGDTLRAMCQTADGRFTWSQLNDWDDCRGGIWNENGQLRCRRDRD